jgi:peptidyl-prolyl cis-trans isomerase C
MLSGATSRGWSACAALAFSAVVSAIPAQAGQPDPSADRSGGSAGSLLPGPPSDNGPSGYAFYRPGEALRADTHNPLVATVDGRNIYLSDIGDAYRELPEGTRQQPADLLYPTLLQGLVSQSALFLEARRQELDTDPDVHRHMVKAMELALVSELLSRTIATKVTEAAIHTRYQQQYADVASVDELHLRVIVMKTEASARDVLGELARGGDFAVLARQRSIDPSGASGGDLGFLQRAQLSPEIADPVFALAVGETSHQPVRQQETWNVFRVEERRSGAVPTFDAARDTIRQELVQETVRAAAEQARAEVGIRTYNVDGTAFQPPEQELLDAPLTIKVETKPPK